MLNPSANPGSSATPTQKVILPTRIITYAWGEKYVQDLLTYAIPALLAPGNLPYVASQVPCELVILSEQHLFDMITSHNVIKQIQTLCKLRLVSLDDLVTSPDSYGMALTYALHRGFADLGPDVTNHWQIFLNADFIMANNSLKSLLDRLMKGERLVASPSYCVNSAAVLPELGKFIDAKTGALVIPPRTMAELALKYRHNTVIGKTLNQDKFHLQYADQFYWEVDFTTLIGHQMPVAIVGMRPERYVAEPNSFWDHGLMEEFCPTATPCILGDSDDFLMIELRDKDVSREDIIYGLPAAQDLAEKMILWVTPYQRDFAQYPLILHSADIPKHAGDGFAKLKAYVDRIFSFVPDELPSHLDHPQWAYHRARFIQSRQKYLTEQVKAWPGISEPPSVLLKTDHEWWKSEAQKNALILKRAALNDVMQHEIKLLKRTAANSEEHIINERIAADNKFNSDISGIIGAQMSGSAQLNQIDLTSSLISNPEFRKALKDHSETTLRLQTADQSHNKIVEAVTRLYQTEFEEIDRKIAAIDNARRLQIADEVPSAAIFQKMRRGPRTKIAIVRHSGGLRRVARDIYYAVLGKWPFAKRTSPYFEAMQLLRKCLAESVSSNSQDILFVGNRTGIMEDLITLNGVHAWIDPEVVISGRNFGLHTRPPQFDICVCDLSFEEIAKFPEVYRGLLRFIRTGGTIIAFHLNTAAIPLLVQGLDLARGLPRNSTRIFSTGTPRTLAYLRRYQGIVSRARGGLIRKLEVLVRLGLLLPRVWLAHSARSLVSQKPNPAIPGDSISITIVTRMLEFEGDDGSLQYAKAAGIYVDGVEAPLDPVREVAADVAVDSGTKIILTFGQSNAANSGEDLYTARGRVHVFNPMDGKFYQAADPLPGASNHEGSVWGRLGDMLVDSGESSVLFVPIAFGGTFIKDWAPGGNCYRRLIFALHRMQIAGLRPSIMCWHQGEADANHTQITTDRYVSDFIAMLKGVRSLGIDAPIYCALATLCDHGDRPFDNRDTIRRAQQRLIGMKNGIRPGPDTDKIGTEHRRDGCHFSASGQKLAAQAWFDAIIDSVD